MSIEIFQGSIFEADAEVLVNPANSFMNHAGGLARVIHECAMGSSNNAYVREDWPEREIDWCRPGVGNYAYLMSLVSAYAQHKAEAPLIPYGGAILGPPGALGRRFRKIVHAVGPIWGGGKHLEVELLMRAHADVLDLVEDGGYNSVVFPAIGAGVFGCPIGVVAACGVRMARMTDLRVVFAVQSDEHTDAYAKQLRLQPPE